MAGQLLPCAPAVPADESPRGSVAALDPYSARCIPACISAACQFPVLPQRNWSCLSLDRKYARLSWLTAHRRVRLCIFTSNLQATSTPVGPSQCALGDTLRYAAACTSQQPHGCGHKVGSVRTTTCLWRRPPPSLGEVCGLLWSINLDMFGGRGKKAAGRLFTALRPKLEHPSTNGAFEFASI